MAFASIVTRAFAALWLFVGSAALPPAYAAPPTPVSQDGTPVDWAFMFKLNAAIFPSSATDPRPCPFGGSAQPYGRFSQQYAFATAASPSLVAGSGLLGTGPADPLYRIFYEIYARPLHFVVWNDQFYRHPAIKGCGESCGAPWGHSKGVLAWDDDGEGMILQVTTPSWPAAGNYLHPRTGDGNTLGCVEDNDVKVSQDFFALRLNRSDVLAVVQGLANASVVTDPTNPTLVQNGGPADIAAAVQTLGVRSGSRAAMSVLLSSGVRLISKPSALAVPPWQMVSALLGGVNLRAATWWTAPAIASTSAATAMGCWDASLPRPGGVEIATSGSWDGKGIGLKGGPITDGNHAKVGVTSAPGSTLTIFGDMNQQGALSGNCKSSQNGRGGLFFVIDNRALHDSIAGLIGGDTAPVQE